jgi:hypothetical protein
MPQIFIQNVPILVKFHDRISSSGANSPSAVGNINRISENTRLQIKHELLQI